MRLSNLANILVVAALLGTTLTVVVPTASAQSVATITVTLQSPQDPVKPLQAPTVLSGTVQFTGDPRHYSNLIGIPITLSVSKQPSWATPILSPTTIIIPIPSTPAPTISATVPYQVFVTASDQAPAFQPDQIEVTATGPQETGGTAAQGKGAATITADYFSILDAQLTETVKIDRPQTAVIFPLKLTNLGNANTKVTFKVGDHPEALQVPIPAPVTLQSKQAGGTGITTEVPLTIQTPYHNGYLNDVGVVSFQYSGAYALDPKKVGDSGSVSVIVTTRGFYVPGPEPILVIGLVALSAVAVRLVRRN